MKFKTNINCNGCISTVSPLLDQTVGTGNWSVDVGNPLRLLTVANAQVSPNEVKTALATQGYEADEIEE